MHPRSIAKQKIYDLITADVAASLDAVYKTCSVYRDRVLNIDPSIKPVVIVSYSGQEDEQVEQLEQTPGDANYERRDVPIAIDVVTADKSDSVAVDNVDTICEYIELLMAKNIKLQTVLTSLFPHSFVDNSLDRVTFSTDDNGNKIVASARMIYMVKYNLIKQGV